MSRPESETADVASAGRIEANTKDEPIFAEFSADRKARATLAAMLAIRGFSLLELACGGYLVARWDRTVHCSDLAQVRAFYQRAIGGAA